MEIKQHTVKSYDKDLESISDTINSIVGLLNISISMVEDIIKNPDKKLIEEINIHDYKINQLDNLTERKVTSMLALRQPLAFDLRYIISALKVSANLERMGDKCKSIIKKISYIETKLDQNIQNSLLKMLDIAKDMTNNAVLAFNEHNTKNAAEVLKQDDEMDKIYHQIFSIAKGENFDQKQVEDIIKILFIAKSFERLADHASNIAEMVSYVVSGEILE
jgi:phosphate transport system protein